METDWAHLLWTCGFRDCSNPLDRIYGLLGMADKSVKKALKENYKADERQVFLDAFRVAIDCDHQLHILSLPFDRGDTLTFELGNSDGLPTWCPNLKKRLNGCVQLNSYFVGIRKPDEKSSKVSRDPISDHLKIQGLEMDKISQIAKSHYPGFEERDRVERPELLSKFQKETLRMTESVYEDADKALEPYCRTLIADVAREHNGRKWSTEEMITGYKSHFTPAPLHAHLSASEKTLSSKYGSLANQACIGRKFILTTNGRVGLAPAGCQVGDVICVFLGACVPHVLRSNVEPPDTTFRFVGDCYLHGIMNMEALDMLDKKEVEPRDFIIT